MEDYLVGVTMSVMSGFWVFVILRAPLFRPPRGR